MMILLSFLFLVRVFLSLFHLAIVSFSLNNPFRVELDSA